MPFPLKRLRRILRSYDAWEEKSRGKGSHTTFFRQLEEGVFSYPIPTHNKEIQDSYVKGVRRRFRLMPEDGVSDEEFFSRG